MRASRGRSRGERVPTSDRRQEGGNRIRSRRSFRERSYREREREDLMTNLETKEWQLVPRIPCSPFPLAFTLFRLSTQGHTLSRRGPCDSREREKTERDRERQERRMAVRMIAGARGKRQGDQCSRVKVIETTPTPSVRSCRRATIEQKGRRAKALLQNSITHTRGMHLHREGGTLQSFQLLFPRSLESTRCCCGCCQREPRVRCEMLELTST